MIQDVFLLKTRIWIDSVKRVLSMNTYILTFHHEEVSKESERACEWSEQANERTSKASVTNWSSAERVSGVSGARKQMY